MATQAAKRAPTGKYYKTGLKQLRELIDCYREADDRYAGKMSFSDQVHIIARTHIPGFHRPWRKAIEDGAVVFDQVGEYYVTEANANLLAGERDARVKRKAKLAAVSAKADTPADSDRHMAASIAKPAPSPERTEAGQPD
ncbi:MAG: hypothetical protein Q7S50_03275 [bacterium]|nr:hypothetical protein [bacterium]